MSEINGALSGLKIVACSTAQAGTVPYMLMADLGAEVIKIETPGKGDNNRNSGFLEGEIGSFFETNNRGVKSLTLNLKSEDGQKILHRLIKDADVFGQNFRPGVIERIGLDYKNVKKINPKIVYGTISGYGSDGPWSSLPGQDLLAQSRTGLVWLNGNGGEAPTPMGLAVADMLAGHTLVEGILAAVIKRFRTDNGSHVETSLVEALLDFQFEVLTTYFNDGNRKPQRSSYNNAHAYLSAPYGIYKTSNGYIAIAMTPLPQLGELLDLNSIKDLHDQKEWFKKRDEIKKDIGDWIEKQTTEHWLSILEPADIWCAKVLDWETMVKHEGFKILDMVQRIKRDDGLDIETLRCPIKIDGEIFKSSKAAPKIGNDNNSILEEFGIS